MLLRESQLDPRRIIEKRLGGVKLALGDCIGGFFEATRGLSGVCHGAGAGYRYCAGLDPSGRP